MGVGVFDGVIAAGVGVFLTGPAATVGGGLGSGWGRSPHPETASNATKQAVRKAFLPLIGHSTLPVPAVPPFAPFMNELVEIIAEIE